MSEKKLTSEDYKRLAKEAADLEKSQEQKKREEESYAIDKWNAFVKSEEVLLETDMKFFRDSQPKYFRKLQTKSWHKKTNVEFVNTEVRFYPPSSLAENWLQLKDQRAKDMFRVMVEGGELIVKNPETGEIIKKTYPSRVYDKITNTLKKVDNITYNMLDLNDKLEPNYEPDDNTDCPIIIKALLFAVSGNIITYDDALGRFVGDKEESLLWMEKWLYGTVYADIGNNMASFPVFYGSGKVGKNALFDVILKQLLGKDACFSGTWDTIHGNFDGYKLGKVMMFIDEVPEKGSWEVLKNMTGSTDAFVKQKYGAEFVIDNTVRYAVGTNEEVYPLPVENGPQMMRVSPIKTSRSSTFAENTVKMLDKYKGENYCRNLLRESDDTLNVDSMDDFTVGDALLRNVLQNEWANRESNQQLLNYLHSTYKSESGNYSLPPLRGIDWDNIVRDKIPAVQKVVDYITDQEIETITTMEMYEIYKVLQAERNDSLKKLNGFSQSIVEPMLRAGYAQHKDAYLKNGVRTTVYSSIVKSSFSEYEMNIDRYIVEIQLGSNALAPKHKKLRYKDENYKTENQILSEKMALLMEKKR